MLHLMKLEDRIVLDGAAVGEAIDHALDHDAVHADAQTDASFVPDDGHDANPFADAAASAAALLADPDPAAEPVDVVLVSDNLSDVDALVDAVDPDAEVIVYDADGETAEDVLGRVTALSEELGRPIESVTILSHGGDGTFRLGSDDISADTVGDTEGAWRQLGSVLAEDGRINIYGCSVSESDHELLTSLADATGASVYASDDVTGAGGDWQLEVGTDHSTGADAPIDIAALAGYTGTLASPTISGAPPTVVQQGDAYSFTPTADDADGDIDQFTISNPPSWADFDPQTGTLSGTPGNDDVGEYTDIRIGVVDSQGNIDGLSFSIEVKNVNDAPIISGTPPTNVQEGTGFSFKPFVADPDLNVDPDETLTFNLTFDGGSPPDWIDFDTGNGTLSGDAPLGMAGTVYNNVVITVQDRLGKQAFLETFSLTVTELNNPPTIEGTPPVTVDQSSEYIFTPVARDIEDGAADLKFSISDIPSWAQFNEQTGVLSGVPANADVGRYDGIEISVTDSGGRTASLEPFSITVKNINDPPTISGSPPFRIQEGATYEFVPQVNDPDISVDPDEELTFGIQNKPDWANFSTVTGRLTGVPGAEDVDKIHNVTITVDDGDAQASINFNIQVLNVNDSPDIFGIPLTEINEDQEYVFQPNYNDPDGDDVDFSISNQPAWAEFNTETGELNGVPLNEHVDTYDNIVITVTDENGNSASLAPFSITVNNVNDPPNIKGTATRSVQVNQSFSFKPTVTDEDFLAPSYNESHQFFIEGLPSWAEFNSETGQIVGTPTDSDIGPNGPITITVRDAEGLTNQMTFDINVVPLNTSPVIEGAPETAVREDQTYSFQPIVRDNEDLIEDLQFSVQGLPVDAVVNFTDTGLLTWEPMNNEVGTYDVILTVTDTGGRSDSLEFDLNVYNENDPPQIKGEAQRRTRIGATYEFTPTGLDPDLEPTSGGGQSVVNPEENLTFSFEGLPSWIESMDSDSGRIFGTVDLEAVKRDLESGLAENPQNAEESVFAIYNIDITVTDAGIGDPRLPDVREAVPPLQATYSYQLRILAPGPGIDAIEPVNFIEDNGPVSLGNIGLTDGGANIDRMDLQIVRNYQSEENGQDVLLFTDMDFGSGNAIDGTWIEATGTLQLKGVATVAEYQEALRSISFDHIGDNPYENADNPDLSDRTVTLTIVDVNGQQDIEDLSVRVDAINDAPDLEPEARTILYTEAGGIVSVAPEITLTDVDDQEMTQAVITISDGTFRPGEDVLSFAAADGITGVWDADTGTLTFTANGGAADIEAFQAALRTVNYQNISGSPDQGSRNITISVTDNNSDGAGFGRLPGAGAGGPMSDDVQRTLDVSISPPHRPPFEPPPFERPPFEPIVRPEGEGPGGPGLGPVTFPGDVQDTGQLQDIARALSAPCGDEVLYQCCTLEEALKIGCRFAPAIDPDARLCNITWDYMTNSLGFEDPFVPMINGRYFNEELDLFNRLFMRDEGDPGFQLAPGTLADAFGMAEEAEWAKFNRDEEHDVYSQFSMQGAQGFNDMAPGELKEAFFKGREGMDRPGRWDNDGDASEC